MRPRGCTGAARCGGAAGLRATDVCARSWTHHDDVCGAGFEHAQPLRATWSMRCSRPRWPAPAAAGRIRCSVRRARSAARSAGRTAGGVRARVHHRRARWRRPRSARPARAAPSAFMPSPAWQFFGHAQHGAARARIGGQFGRIGFLRIADREQRRRERPATGMRRCSAPGRACSRMNRLTMRSSSEWKLITASRPPGVQPFAVRRHRGRSRGRPVRG